MRTLAIAAAALLFAGTAYAQSAVQNPSVPGSGYKAPEKANMTGPATNDKGEMPKGGKNRN